MVGAVGLQRGQEVGAQGGVGWVAPPRGRYPSSGVSSSIATPRVIPMLIRPTTSATSCQPGTPARSRKDSSTTERRYETQPVPNFIIGSASRSGWRAA